MKYIILLLFTIGLNAQTFDFECMSFRERYNGLAGFHDANITVAYLSINTETIDFGPPSGEGCYLPYPYPGTFPNSYQPGTSIHEETPDKIVFVQYLQQSTNYSELTKTDTGFKWRTGFLNNGGIYWSGARFYNTTEIDCDD